MENAAVLSIALSLVATLFAILMAVIAWFGSRLINKQDELLEKLTLIKDEIYDAKEEIYARISKMDVRLVRVETLVNDEV